MIKFFQRFARDESGAVTVDWVVLTAAVVGLAIAVAATVQTGLGNIANDISTDMQNQLNGASGTTYSGGS